jgi:hypothetical protein
MPVAALAEQRLADLKAMLDDMRRQRDDMKADRDRWRDQADAWREEAQASQKQLADQRARARAAEPVALAALDWVMLSPSRRSPPWRVT